jgi:co-chaperonin GroES (HSP10)
MAAFEHTKLPGIRALNDHVIVRDMDFGNRTLSSGIVLLNDDGKTAGIRPRWAHVYTVGPAQQEVKAGQWVYVEHGRWTRGSQIEIDGEQMTIRRVDPKDIMMVSDEPPPADDTFSTAVQTQAKTR